MDYAQLFQQGGVALVLVWWFVKHSQALQQSAQRTIERLIDANVEQNKHIADMNAKLTEMNTRLERFIDDSTDC